MEERIKNYEAQIANLKRWRNWLYVVVFILFAIITVTITLDQKKGEENTNDAEVLYAAGQIEYKGLDKYDILYHDRDKLDIKLYVEWAKQDLAVQLQMEKNRNKGKWESSEGNK